MEAVLLMISDSTATLFLMLFLSPQGLFALLNPCVTRGSSFVDDFCVHRGSFHCRIHVSPMEAVSLRISK